MKKRLLSLLLSLCIMVALLPAASAADGENFLQYYTDNMLTDEEITLGGIPIYDLTYDKAKEILASMVSENTGILDTYDNRRCSLGFGDSKGSTRRTASISAEEYDEKSVVSFDVSYSGKPASGGRESFPLKSEIRGITLGDSLEETMKKLGVSDEGAKILSDQLPDATRNFDFRTGFYDSTGYQPASCIYWYGERYFILFQFDKRELVEFRITAIAEGYTNNGENTGWDDATQTKEERKDSTPEEADISDDEYIYDVPDPGEDIVLPVWRLEEIIDADCTVRSIDTLLEEVPLEKLKTPTGTDLATLYAETAIMRAACKEVNGGDLMINAALLKIVGSVAEEAQGRLEEKLESVGIPPAREISKTITLMTDETTLDIRIDPDVLQTQIDKIRVETPTYALTFKLEDLKDGLTDVLQFRAEDTGGGYRPSNVTKKAGTKTVVKLTLPKPKMSNPVTVSMPKQTGKTVHQAVVSTDGQATASKYNPASDLIDGKVNTSGSYTVKSNEKDFSDIANKSQEMQKAIRYLASKGIINGTTETAFSPDGSINRAEIATLIVKALGKLDPSAASGFTDVPAGSWYAAAAASSQRQGYIQGFEDHTFRGPTVINKVQIISVSSRVLQKEMRYKAPAAPASILTKYSDTVDTWAQSDVALATKENLVLYRKDGTFSGRSNMTRGNAAIIIYRLFQRLW